MSPGQKQNTTIPLILQLDTKTNNKTLPYQLIGNVISIIQTPIVLHSSFLLFTYHLSLSMKSSKLVGIPSLCLKMHARFARTWTPQSSLFTCRK